MLIQVEEIIAPVDKLTESSGSPLPLQKSWKSRCHVSVMMEELMKVEVEVAFAG